MGLNWKDLPSLEYSICPSVPCCLISFHSYRSVLVAMHGHCGKTMLCNTVLSKLELFKCLKVGCRFRQPFWTHVWPEVIFTQMKYLFQNQNQSTPKEFREEVDYFFCHRNAQIFFCKAICQLDWRDGEEQSRSREHLIDVTLCATYTPMKLSDNATHNSQHIK